MTKIEYFKEDIKVCHWDKPGLEGFIYHDIFEPSFFTTIKKLVNSTLALGETKTYLTHATTFNIDGQGKKIVSHAQSAREQCVIYDISFNRQWYFQTNDTIKSWADNTLQKTISPVFYKCMKVLETLDPLSQEKDSWVFYRCHINYLASFEHLALHMDAAMQLTKPFADSLDHSKARMYSFTCYLYDHIDGLGGEIWTPYGFVFKPKANSGIMIKGHQAIHGVTQNIDSTPRLAFTFRLAHKDDLFLPGSPDKFLYDVSSNL